MRAAGVDYNSKNKLRKLWKKGHTVEEAGFMISVEDEVVKSFFDQWDAEKPKTEKKASKEK